jgi:prevent-host-death family protein
LAKSVSVAEAKSRFSELVQRASYGGERFLIEKRGKPVGAIVSVDALVRLEEGTPSSPGQGLLAAVGAMAEFDEFESIMQEVMKQREQARDREVDLE